LGDGSSRCRRRNPYQTSSPHPLTAGPPQRGQVISSHSASATTVATRWQAAQ